MLKQVTTKKDWIKLTCELIPNEVINSIPNTTKEKLASKLYNDNFIVSPITEEQMSPLEAVEDYLEDQFSLDLVSSTVMDSFEEMLKTKGVLDE